jgi:hypothetical protein
MDLLKRTHLRHTCFDVARGAEREIVGHAADLRVEIDAGATP